jgi:hypothetical protein
MASKRRNFFADIGAPLKDPFAWGAVRHKDRSVFLRCWKDDLENSETVVRLQNPEKHPDGLTGTSPRERHFRERLEHIDLIVNSGYRCFVVLADAKDCLAWVRQISRTGRAILLTEPIVNDGVVSDRRVRIVREVGIDEILIG